MNWLRDRRNLVTPKAYAGFVSTMVAHEASQQRAWKVFLPLLWEMCRFGSPRIIDFLQFLLMWLIPPKMRRKIQYYACRKVEVPEIRTTVRPPDGRGFAARIEKGGLQMSKKSVLMIGSGRKVRGGIASVITAYTKNAVWGEFNCRWLETHSDINNGTKIWVALLALMKAPFLMSRSDMVHIHTASDVSMYRKTIFLTIAMVLRKKVIIHLHAADDDSLFGRPLFSAARHVFSHADLVVVCQNIGTNSYTQFHLMLIPVSYPIRATSNMRPPKKLPMEIIRSFSRANWKLEKALLT